MLVYETVACDRDMGSSGGRSHGGCRGGRYRAVVLVLYGRSPDDRSIQSKSLCIGRTGDSNGSDRTDDARHIYAFGLFRNSLHYGGSTDFVDTEIEQNDPVMIEDFEGLGFHGIVLFMRFRFR